jgi:hypothetical protein
VPGRDLTPLEEQMVAGAAAGELVDRGKGPFSLADMQAWAEERTVRAAVLRHLLISNEWSADARGVRLRGVRISGRLDLKAATLRCPLYLESCFLEADPVCLDQATALALTITRCRLAGLTGEMLTASALDLSGSTLTGPLRLPRADIAGALSCSGAQLIGCDDDGSALFADGIKVGFDAFLDDGFTARGAILLRLADITGMLSCRDAHLNGRNSDGYSLAAYGMQVTGDLWLDESFTAVGGIALQSARVGRHVWLRQGTLTADKDGPAFDAAGAQIAGTLRWAPTQQVAGRVSLDGAAVGELDDADAWVTSPANGFWPTDGRLSLKGFTYNRITGNHPPPVEKRLDWIRSQYQPPSKDAPPVFATQPYEQLAAVCRRAGQDTAARTVAIARRSDLRTYGNLSTHRKAVNWLLDVTIKYGYQTWRAGLLLVAVFVAFLVLAVLGQHLHVIVPVGNIKGLQPVPTATQSTSNYPCFYPAGYAIDTVIPIVNVHQADYWGPDGHAAWGWVWVGAAWLATGLGWALATLLVAGYTGLVRQE